MTAFLAKCAWGRAWPSSSRIEDEEMRRAMRVIQVCVVGEAVISLPLSSATSAHDQRVRSLALLTSPVSQGRLAPRGDRVAAGRVMRLAAAVRMVDRVHGDASA